MKLEEKKHILKLDEFIAKIKVADFDDLQYMQCPEYDELVESEYPDFDDFSLTNFDREFALIESQKLEIETLKKEKENYVNVLQFVNYGLILVLIINCAIMFNMYFKMSAADYIMKLFV